MVSLPILAGAYPPVASNPRFPVPQNVSRTPPAAPTLREISSPNAPTELLVGTYAPTHGVSSTPPCAAAGVAAVEITARAVTEPASVPISFRIDIPTPYQKLLGTQTGRWLTRAVRAPDCSGVTRMPGSRSGRCELSHPRWVSPS